MGFYCHGCGLCCQRLDKIIEHYNEYPSVVRDIIDEFPYTHENGRCEKLNDDNTCSVYEDRPDLCNVEKFGKRAVPDMPKNLHESMQESGCRTIMRESGKYTEEEIKTLYSTRPGVHGKNNRK